MCNVDIRENLYVNVVSPGDTAFFKGAGKRMFKELTALASFSMMFRWLLHLSESTQYGLECKGWPVESTTLFPVLHDVRRWHLQGLVRRCRALRWHNFFIMMRHVDLRENLYAMSCSQVARPFSKGSRST